MAFSITNPNKVHSAQNKVSVRGFAEISTYGAAAVWPRCLFVDDQTRFLPRCNLSYMDFLQSPLKRSIAGWNTERERDGNGSHIGALPLPRHAALIETSGAFRSAATET